MAFFNKIEIKSFGEPDNTKNVNLEKVEISPEGIVVPLKKYGFIEVFRIVPADGDAKYWATDVLDMDESTREDLSKKSQEIEEYHRGIKQFYDVEKCQARKKSCREHM
jgi:hypothetical protein